MRLDVSYGRKYVASCLIGLMFVFVCIGDSTNAVRLSAETQKIYHELSSGLTLGRLPGHDIYKCLPALNTYIHVSFKNPSASRYVA